MLKKPTGSTEHLRKPKELQAFEVESGADRYESWAVSLVSEKSGRSLLSEHSQEIYSCLLNHLFLLKPKNLYMFHWILHLLGRPLNREQRSLFYWVSCSKDLKTSLVTGSQLCTWDRLQEGLKPVASGRLSLTNISAWLTFRNQIGLSSNK